MLALKAEVLKSLGRAVAISMKGCCTEELKKSLWATESDPGHGSWALSPDL